MKPGTTSRVMMGVALSCSAFVAGCNRGDDRTSAATERQATAVQPANQPLTVSGCLRAGDAEGMFVLTAARSVSGEQTATYHLVGLDGVNLGQHVGRQVEVQGVVNTQQQVATRSSTDPAPNATGTAGTPGTPSVSTTTKLDIKRLDVKEIKAIQGECPA